ncbi:MAG TPA: DoxX family protein [Bacteroidales bacterium]|nr:DoxX family protein [Bacteroidales bacterium]
MKNQKIFHNIIYLFVVFTRILVGFVFIFSGFVKAVDPLGSAYKFVDYFTAFNMPWLESIALFLAFLLIGFEFLIGWCLVLFIKPKLMNWGAFIFMVLFTPLTLWLAIEDPVKDCGCFGDAIILTNWQTFYKNIIILFFIVISFFYNINIKSWLNYKKEWLIIIITFFSIISFSYYNLEHLPVIDFRPYKVGTYIPEKMKVPEGASKDEYEQYLTLKDTVNGNEIKIEAKEYTKDSTYWGHTSVWKFISSSKPVLIKKGYEPPIHDFVITSDEGIDITENILSDTVFYFLIIAHDLKKYDLKNQEKINKLYQNTKLHSQKFICVTSSILDDVTKFKKENKILYEFYVADPITLKTIIRSNPGMVLLNNGRIIAKWHCNDIPSYENIYFKYIKK